MKLFLSLLVFTSAAVVAQETLFSGPQPGEAIPGFPLLAVNGPDAGREVDFVSRYGAAPVMLIFLHQIDRNVAALIQPCEKFAQDRVAAGLKTLYIYLTADKIEGERRMQAVTKSLRLQSQVAVSVDGVEGPGSYGLNKNVATTILVGKGGKVTANFAIVQPGMVDAPKVLAEAGKLVGGHVPTLVELEAERAGQARRGGMQPQDPPELQSMLRSLIQKTNSSQQVDNVIASLRAWAADDRRRSLLLNKLNLIIPLRYGTEYAQTRMQTLKAEVEKR